MLKTIKLAPTGQGLHEITQALSDVLSEGDIEEGPDDTPSHIKSILTSTSLSTPFENKKLCLGKWQGVFLWEHRHNPSLPSIVAHLGY